VLLATSCRVVAKDRGDDGAQVYLLEYLERAADRKGQGPTGQNGKKRAIGLGARLAGWW
jgi:hypothetical protein